MLPGPWRECSNIFLTIEFGPFAVLHNLVKIVLQHIRNLADLASQLGSKAGPCECLPQFIDKLDGNGREIVYEIERILDLVRDAGRQLAERGKLLSLDEAVLRGPQALQRLRQFACARLYSSKRRAFWMASTDCAPKVCNRLTVPWGKSPGCLRRTTSAPTIRSAPNSGTASSARNPARLMMSRTNVGSLLMSAT